MSALHPSCFDADPHLVRQPSTTSTNPSPPGSTTPASDKSEATDGYPDKARFYHKVEQHIQSRKIKAILTADEIVEIARLISSPVELKNHPNPSYRKWVTKHFVLRKTSKGGSIVAHRSKGQLVAKEHLYDTLLAAHSKEPHGGRDKTTREIHNAGRWILKGLVELFVKSCPTCHVRNEAATRSRAATIAANDDLHCSTTTEVLSRGGSVGPSRTVRSFSTASAASQASMYGRFRTTSEMAPSVSASPSPALSACALGKHQRSQSGVPNYFNDFSQSMPSVVFAPAPNDNNHLRDQPRIGRQRRMREPSSLASAFEDVEEEDPLTESVETAKAPGMMYHSSSVCHTQPSTSSTRILQSEPVFAVDPSFALQETSRARTLAPPFTVTEYLSSTGMKDMPHDMTDSHSPSSHATSFDDVQDQVQAFPVSLVDQDDFSRFYSNYSFYSAPGVEKSSGVKALEMVSNPSVYTPTSQTSVAPSTYTTSQPNSAASIIPPPPFGQDHFQGMFCPDFNIGSMERMNSNSNGLNNFNEFEVGKPTLTVSNIHGSISPASSVEQWDELLGNFPPLIGEVGFKTSREVSPFVAPPPPTLSVGPWSEILNFVEEANHSRQNI